MISKILKKLNRQQYKGEQFTSPIQMKTVYPIYVMYMYDT